MSKLWDYFGFVGVSSLLLWLAVLVMLLIFRRSPRRTAVYAGCIGAAVLAALLARWNFINVSYIMVDRGDQQAAIADEGEAELRAEAIEALRRNAAQINFAEDDPTDALDVAGAQEVDPSVVEQAGAAEYAYRERGKQQREAGKKRNSEEIQEAAEVVTNEPTLRYMSETDVMRATALARLNRSLAKWVLFAAAVALVVDYLSRLNRTWGGYWPLPIAGRWIDAVFRKTHSTLVSPAGQQDIDALLTFIVRKGETYIDMGPAAQHADDAVARLSLRGRPLVLLPRYRVEQVADEAQLDWVFESAWFGRACFVIGDIAEARRFMAYMLDRLRMRRIPQARARRTVNLVWRFDDAPDAALLDEALNLCPEVNFKLIVRAPATDATAVLGGFEERLTLGSA